MKEWKNLVEHQILKKCLPNMKKQNQAGSYYINELDIVVHDKTEKLTKIIYDYGNGETKVLNEDSVIGLLELFHTDFSK